MTRVVLAVPLVIVAACSGDADDGHMERDPEDDFRGCPPDVPWFAPGLQARSAQHTLTLLAADPAEPERYENDWMVELSPADAELVRGQTFMPVHGHDGRVEPAIEALPNPGQYTIERLHFTMRGPWEVRLWTSAGADAIVFQVCVAR